MIDRLGFTITQGVGYVPEPKADKRDRVKYKDIRKKTEAEVDKSLAANKAENAKVAANNSPDTNVWIKYSTFKEAKKGMKKDKVTRKYLKGFKKMQQ